MKNINKYLIGLIITIVSFSCEESSLSDIEISNSSIIRAKVYILQDFDNRKEVIVSLKDSRGYSINLKNGYVMINDNLAEFELPSTDFFVNKAYIYKPSFYDRDFTIKIRINSETSYEFKINGERFPGFLTNQAVSNIYYRTYKNKIFGSSKFYGTPFYNDEISFKYEIINEISRLED